MLESRSRKVFLLPFQGKGEKKKRLIAFREIFRYFIEEWPPFPGRDFEMPNVVKQGGIRSAPQPVPPPPAAATKKGTWVIVFIRYTLDVIVPMH